MLRWNEGFSEEQSRLLGLPTTASGTSFCQNQQNQAPPWWRLRCSPLRMGWDTPDKSQACHKKKKVPQIPMLICPVETTGSMWKWVGVGMVIRSVISVIGAGWTKRRKSFTLIIASSSPRLLQNRFQLQVWFPFLEDQAEFMHRKCELDFGYGGKNFFFLIPYSLNMEIKLVLETNH